MSHLLGDDEDEELDEEELDEEESDEEADDKDEESLAPAGMQAAPRDQVQLG